ncbi:MAG TPA: hypothetical protein VJ986_02500, partial [Gaiellaceae bacterium]|nr:hypothetical protein [Gaiellaceae bacterium]
MGVLPPLRLLAGLVLFGSLVAPAAQAARPSSSAPPVSVDTIGRGGFSAAEVPDHYIQYQIDVGNAPAKPVFHWAVEPPDGYPACKTFMLPPVATSGAGSSTIYIARIWLHVGVAGGCHEDVDYGGWNGKITVTIAMGSTTCTAVTDTTGEHPATCTKTSSPASPPAAGSSSKKTDAMLRQVGRKALTLELRQLPVLLHKPWLRKAVFTHFTFQTRAAIDHALEQKKIAQAEQAKTHARLQRELRQGWKKVWDVRAELESYKDLSNRYVDAYDTLGKFEALVSAGLASVPGGALFLPLTMGMGGAARITEAEWARNAADPPDKHYTALVTPATPAFPAIPAAQGVPAGLVDAATAFLADDGKAIGLVTAFRRSFERAQGAAAAGSAAWTARQLGAAATFADSAAAALGS